MSGKTPTLPSNYVTFKQLYEKRLKEKQDEEERLRKLKEKQEEEERIRKLEEEEEGKLRRKLKEKEEERARNPPRSGKKKQIHRERRQENAVTQGAAAATDRPDLELPMGEAAAESTKTMEESIKGGPKKNKKKKKWSLRKGCQASKENGKSKDGVEKELPTSEENEENELEKVAPIPKSWRKNRGHRNRGGISRFGGEDRLMAAPKVESEGKNREEKGREISKENGESKERVENELEKIDSIPEASPKNRGHRNYGGSRFGSEDRPIAAPKVESDPENRGEKGTETLKENGESKQQVEYESEKIFTIPKASPKNRGRRYSESRGASRSGGENRPIAVLKVESDRMGETPAGGTEGKDWTAENGRWTGQARIRTVRSCFPSGRSGGRGGMMWVRKTTDSKRGPASWGVFA